MRSLYGGGAAASRTGETPGEPRKGFPAGVIAAPPPAHTPPPLFPPTPPHPTMRSCISSPLPRLGPLEQQVRDQRRPTGLVARTAAPSRVPVEVLGERYQVAPGRIALQQGVLTRGGPANATEMIGMYMYSTSFSLFKLGLGSAISVIMFLAVAIFTLLQWRFVGFGSSEQW